MEFTETEVKMFKEAEEIQALWSHSKRSSGDWYFHTELNCAYAVSDIDQEDSHCIWLPSQEQLQGIYLRGLGPIHASDLAYSFGKFTAIFHENNPYYDFSMTQLWLAFVMHKKYQKVWDGETWVKETSS